MILFTDIRGDTRAIIGYDDQSVISNLISQYDEDKEEFTLLWEGVDLRLYSLIHNSRGDIGYKSGIIGTGCNDERTGVKLHIEINTHNKHINFCLDGSNPLGQKFCCIHS